jgi:hypothetical protein
MFMLSGCSDFDEMKSQRALIKAEALMEQGLEEEAMQALSKMIAMYPATNAGEVAQKHLVRIERQRERRERMAFTRVLDSYRQVLNGYRSLYSEYPRTLSDMDEKGYFFDAAYLEEVTPAGYTVFLWLREDGSGYRLWSTNDGKERGYSLGSESYTYSAFETEEQLDKLRGRFATDSWSSPLVLLRSK